MRLNCLLLITLVLLGLAGCSKPAPDVFTGYAEGEYVLVASPFAGALSRLAVKRGDTVRLNQPLFVLEQANEKAGREQAQAQLAHAEAQLQDLLKGKRPAEVEAVRAQLSQAEASLAQSQAQYRRDVDLAKQNFISHQQLDQSRAAYERDKANVEQQHAQLDISRLAAREDQIKAARHDVDAAREALAQADWKLAQKSQQSPAAGLVADTLFVEGEWVPAGTPVVSLLPPGNIKARFYIPETMLGILKIGQAVKLSCDGCSSVIPARISYIAPQAEYTPPVIYSRENRSKLMFLVEAHPSPADAVKLHPGQPLEVTLAEGKR